MVEELTGGYGGEADLGGGEQLKKILRAARDARLRLVLWGAFGLILGTGVASMMPDLYECQTLMLVRERQLIDDSTLLNSLKDKPLVQKEATLAQELRSYNWIYDVLEKAEWVEFAEVKHDRTKLNALIDKVRDDSKFKVAVETDAAGELLIKLIFSWYDAKQAHDFLRAARKNWIARREQESLKYWSGKQQSAEKLVAKRRELYETKKTKLQNFQTEHKMTASTDTSVDQNLRSQLYTLIMTAEAEVNSLDTELKSLQERLAKTDEKKENRQKKKNPDYDRAKEAATSARDQLSKLQERYTDSHPKVKQGIERVKELEDELAALKGQEFEVDSIQEETNPTWIELSKQIDSVEPKLRGKKELLNKYKFQRDEVDRRLSDWPTLMNKLTTLEDEVEMVQQQLTAAEVEITPLRDKVQLLRESSAVSFTDSEEAAEATGAFEILEEPVIPDKPTGLPRAVISLIGLLVGVATALAISVLGVVANSTYDRAEEVSSTLRLPVLGAVGRIATPAELRGEKVRRVVQAAGGVLIVVSLGVLVYVVTARPELLPVWFQSFLEDMRANFQ